MRKVLVVGFILWFFGVHSKHSEKSHFVDITEMRKNDAKKECLYWLDTTSDCAL